MQLASTDETLDFLQREYAKFRTYSVEQQEQCLEFNELVRVRTEKLELPLRLLYIDLLMYDEMIRRSKSAHDTNRERIELLIRNKLALLRLIQHRESVYESVTPDLRTENKDATLDEVLSWFPPERRADFREKLHSVWKRWKKKRIDTEHLLQNIFQQCVVMGCRSVEDFRALVSIVELVLFQSA